MSVTFKDIDNYSQKSSVAGTEKIPVSDSEYISPSQIASLVNVPTNVSAFTNDANYAKYYLCADEAAYNAIQNKDSGTLYLIPESS